MLLRRGARAGEWTVLAAASRPAVPLDLAASGRSLCAYTAMGVSCSQDGGGRFAFLLAEPFSPAGDLAVDGERLYLIRRRDYRLQVLSHTLASAGPWGTIIDTSLSHEIRLAARTGLLLTLDGFPSASIRLSRDQGASFARLAFPPATGVWIMTAALGRRIWAIANSDYHARPLPYSVFRNLYLSGDSGRTYRALSPFPARLIAIGATDSSLFGLDSAGSLHEYRIRDSAWHDLPAPGGAAASALAASDSVLYAFAGGKLWRRNLYDTPAAIRPMRGGPGRNRSARRGAAEFAKAGGGRKWNALGKDAGSRP
jgi:hypothetical protein